MEANQSFQMHFKFWALHLCPKHQSVRVLLCLSLCFIPPGNGKWQTMLWYQRRGSSKVSLIRLLTLWSNTFNSSAAESSNCIPIWTALKIQAMFVWGCYPAFPAQFASLNEGSSQWTGGHRPPGIEGDPHVWCSLLCHCRYRHSSSGKGSEDCWWLRKTTCPDAQNHSLQQLVQETNWEWG